MASFKGGIVLKGAEGLDRAFDRLNEKIKKLSPEEVYQLGLMIMEKSKTLVPVDTGLLQSSGYVDRPVVSAGGRYVRIEMGYGRGTRAENYAMIQHENDEYYHRIGEAHYLLNAVEDYRAMAPRILKQRILAALSPL